MKFSDKTILSVSIIITLVLIAWLGYDLYKRGMEVGIDWSLAIIAFWISSAILFMSLFSESRVFIVIRSLAIYILAGISIYASMGLKFDIDKMKQTNTNSSIEKFTKIDQK